MKWIVLYHDLALVSPPFRKNLKYTKISEKKGDSDDLTVAMIRKLLKKYVENREFADLHCQQDDTEYQSSARSTTEAFYTGSGSGQNTTAQVSLLQELTLVR